MLAVMFTQEFYIVFPEGDTQEVAARLGINALVDVNGRLLPLPLATNRIIAFRVERISVQESRGGSETYHHLELVGAADLSAYVR
jgi:hypothetical protein